MSDMAEARRHMHERQELEKKKKISFSGAVKINNVEFIFLIFHFFY